ncbi:hypothetical protein JTB14_036104 [Gonioctena quinquepunctata]|nr:hypothetical protein JTB14_036104 [Gonioctena quinquepunctata]
MGKARDNNKKISHEYGMQGTMVNVDFVNKNHHSKPSSQNRVRKSFRDRDAERRQPERNHPKPMTRSCRKCGNQHGYGKCPAFGSIEDARGKEVDKLEVESWVLELEINERPVEFKLDTGAMANVIPTLEIFGNIEGVKVYVDDLIIAGKTIEEHNSRLKKVFELAVEHKLRFNKNKCKIFAKEVEDMGHKISKFGSQADDSKIQAIKNMPQPKNKEDIQRFLGLVTYVGRFIENLSEKTAPLRELIKKDIVFSWEKVHNETFENLKIIITLLDLRNSPIDNENSPANILMNRNLRTILPQTNKIFQSKLFNKPKYDNFIRKSQKNMKTHYDNQGVKELKELKNNCLVKVQLKPKGLWESGRIVDKVGIGSYRIQMENNKIFIRNRKFIREDKKVHFQPSRTINTEQHDEQYKDNKCIEIQEGDIENKSSSVEENQENVSVDDSENFENCFGNNANRPENEFVNDDELFDNCYSDVSFNLSDKISPERIKERVDRVGTSKIGTITTRSGRLIKKPSCFEDSTSNSDSE